MKSVKSKVVKSDIDVSNKGMFDYRDIFITPIEGVELKVSMDSDKFLDAMVAGDIDRVLDFK